ncbi:21007_t:CDS:2, partial [Rhizophagus irregularis]
MNLRQIFFALLIVLMATIVTASPLNLDQLIKRKNAQKDESPSKEKDGKVRATFAPKKGG